MIALVFKDFELQRRPLPTSPSGRAWFVLAGTSFPDEEWFDFPLSMLGSAFDAYQELRRGALDATSYVFDGPYHLEYRRPAPVVQDSVTVGAYAEDDDAGLKRTLIAETEVSLGELGNTLRESARAMASALSHAEAADGENSRIVAEILAGLEPDSLR